MSSLRDENIRLKMLVNENSPNNKSFSELSDIRNKSPNKSLDKLIKVINIYFFSISRLHSNELKVVQFIK